MNKTFTPQNSLANKVTDQKEEYAHEPSKKIVDTLLSYSKVLSVRDSKIVNKVEIILN
jgi:hypothetical protein